MQIIQQDKTRQDSRPSLLQNSIFTEKMWKIHTLSLTKVTREIVTGFFISIKISNLEDNCKSWQKTRLKLFLKYTPYFSNI